MGKKIYKSLKEAYEETLTHGEIEYDCGLYARPVTNLEELLAVAPISYVDAVKKTQASRERAAKAISERRKIALEVVEAMDEDRYKNMSTKQKKFNKAEPVKLSEAYKRVNEELDEHDKVISLDEFKPWNGAVVVYDKIAEAGKLETLEYILNELYPDYLDAQTLNDLLWFESNFLYEQLGMIDELEYTDELEDEEEEE